MPKSTDQLMSHVPIAEIIEAYIKACSKIEAGYSAVEDAYTSLNDAFGVIAFGNDALLKFYPPRDETIPVLREIKRKAWYNIIETSGVRKLMSTKRMKELDDNLQNDKLPALTVENVWSLFRDILNNTNEIAVELVKEAFEFLRPGARYQNKLKTNEKFAKYELGKKVILPYYVEHGFGNPFRVGTYRDDRLTVIDKTFHLLDGKSMNSSYRSPIIDAINTSQDGKGETDYFKFTCYENGNLHITFRRPDLVKLLNQVAVDGTMLCSERML